VKLSASRPRLREQRITLAHGAGGKATRALLDAVFFPALANRWLEPLGDAALLDANGSRLALTTDSYVVKPRFFPGGDIGKLAVHGTINDLAVSGARPIALTAGFVLEEGLEIEEVRAVADSMAAAAAEAGIAVVAGDTKVVEQGTGDGLYVTTSGLGVVDPRAELSPTQVRAGDRVLLSGTIADHGVAVMIARGSLALEADVRSDSAPLHELVRSLLALGPSLRWMRDPTRGGVATAMNELADASGLGVVLDEQALPVAGEVAAACEILGIDPLYVANEGKLLAVVAADRSDDALALLRAQPLGRHAALIGAITEEPARVSMTTLFGGRRIVDVLVGDPLPRIC
jgi:hydrogenase expression/formation protein HypE